MTAATRGSSPHPTSHNLRGITFVEILMALILLSLCVVPVVGLFSRGYASAAVSEDRVYAETLASRVLEAWRGYPYEELQNLQGRTIEGVVASLFEEDLREPWFDSMPEYARNLSVGKDFFTGTLQIREVAPGLLSLEATIHYRVMHGTEEVPNRFILLTFRAREDLSLLTPDLPEEL